MYLFWMQILEQTTMDTNEMNSDKERDRQKLINNQGNWWMEQAKQIYCWGKKHNWQFQTD